MKKSRRINLKSNCFDGEREEMEMETQKRVLHQVKNKDGDVNHSVERSSYVK